MTCSSSVRNLYFFFQVYLIGLVLIVESATAAAATALGIRAPPCRRALLRAWPAPRHIDRGGAPPSPLLLLLLLLLPMLLLLPQRGGIARTSCHQDATTSTSSPFWNDAS